MPPPVYDQGPLKGQPIPGMLQSGNVDVNHRPSIKNAGGSSSSIFSMTVPIGKDGSPIPWPKKGQSDPRITGYALVPSIANGKFLTSDGKMPDKVHMGDLEDAATSYYAKTRQHLGIFSSPDAADKYATSNHDYGNDGTAATVYSPSPTEKGPLMPDYEALAAKHGGVVSSGAPDYEALAAKYGGTVSQSTLPEASTDTMQAHPNTLSNWFEDVGNDIKHGTTITAPGRVLHAIGAQPTRTGEPGGSPANTFGNAMVGVTELGHSLFDTDSSPLLFRWAKNINGPKMTQNANEAFRGAMHVITPAAAMIAPETILPTVAAYGPVGAGITRGANALGFDPDTSELIGNAAMVAAPGVKETLPEAGRFLQNHAEGIGKVGGYGTAIAEAVRGKGSPQSLIIGALGGHPASKLVTGATNALGRGTEAVGNTPILPHEIGGFSPEAPDPTGGAQVSTVPDLVNTQHFAENTMGMRQDPASVILPPARTLGPGAIELPPSGADTSPLIRPAASQIVRGPKGRMTKQYLTSEDQGTGPQHGAQEPIEPKLGESKAPPPLNPGTAITDTTTGSSFGPEEPVNPQEESVPQDDEAIRQAGQDAILQGQREGAVQTPIQVSQGVQPRVETQPEATVQTEVRQNQEPETQEQPLESKEVAPPEDVLPGDFSLNTPQRFYHGSDAPNLINTGLEAREPGVDKANQGGPYPKGVYLTPDEDLIDTHGFQQEARDRMDRDQQSADELQNKIFYQNNKVRTAKSTQEHGYNPGNLPGENGNTDLLPWAQTPWGSNEGAVPLTKTGPDKLLPGDFSLHTPSTFYHGSNANLIGKDILPNPPDNIRANAEDHTGVYLATNPNAAGEYDGGGGTYQVDLPRKTFLRHDPDQPGALIHPGPIPSSRTSLFPMQDYWDNKFSPPEEFPVQPPQKSGPQLIQVPEPQTPPGPVFTADELKGLQKTQKPGPKRIK